MEPLWILFAATGLLFWVLWFMESINSPTVSRDMDVPNMRVWC